MNDGQGILPLQPAATALAGTFATTGNSGVGREVVAFKHETIGAATALEKINALSERADINAVPPIEVSDRTSLARTVETYLEGQFALIRSGNGGSPHGKRVVIITGDHHYSWSATIMQFAAMASAKRHSNGTPSLMFETADLANTIGNARAVNKSVSNTGALPSLGKDDLPNIRAGVLADIAGQAGFNRKAFDPKKRQDSPLGAVRENAMLESIRLELASASGPVLVATGALHLPVLREGLLQAAHVIALDDISLDWDRDAFESQGIREGYLERCPEVQRFKAPESLANQPLHDYLNFAQQLGLT